MPISRGEALDIFIFVACILFLTVFYLIDRR